MNWQNMQAGRELDRIVAERLGYTVRDVVDSEYPHSGVPLNGSALFNPDGQRISVVAHISPQDGWNLVPQFSTDLNEAVKLADLIPGELRLTLYQKAPTIWQAWFNIPSVPQATEETSALALCRAFLVWVDSGEKSRNYR